jgi:hypothetical protein
VLEICYRYSACSTVNRVRCVFPFKFESGGNVQGRCAKNPAKGNAFQCATKADPATGVGLEFDDCLQDSCPLD